MTDLAWDLDAAPEPDAVDAPSGPGHVVLLALALAGLAVGALAGSVLSPAGEPQFPPAATLSVRDVGALTSARVSAAGAQARTGDAVAVLRLEVDNPSDEPVRLTAVAVEGVARERVTVPLDLEVAGRQSRAVDLTLRPDCALDRRPVPIRARLTVAGGRWSDGDQVQVTPARLLSRGGGLCSQFNADLPRGWRLPLPAITARLDGRDLLVTVDDLSGQRLLGLVVDGQLLPTVLLGDTLLPSSARLSAGEVTTLRLRGPPPCLQVSGATPVPTTLRLLAEDDGLVEQRLVVVGPALTRWLRLDCGGR